MISYKWDVLERQSLSEVKMGRGSPICEIASKKTEICQIAKALQILSSTEHNIIVKRFKETGEISVCKEPGRRPMLETCGPQITLHHSSA